MKECLLIICAQVGSSSETLILSCYSVPCLQIFSPWCCSFAFSTQLSTKRRMLPPFCDVLFVASQKPGVCEEQLLTSLWQFSPLNATVPHHFQRIDVSEFSISDNEMFRCHFHPTSSYSCKIISFVVLASLTNGAFPFSHIFIFTGLLLLRVFAPNYLHYLTLSTTYTYLQNSNNRHKGCSHHTNPNNQRGADNSSNR